MFRNFSQIATPLRWLLVALLCLQMGALIFALQPWLTGDTPDYVRLAQALEIGRYGYERPFGFEPDVLRPPAYPMILMALQGVLGLSDLGIVLLQGSAYLLALALIVSLFRKHGGNSVLLLALAVIYPFGMAYAVRLSAEAWAALGLSTIAYLVARDRLSVANSIAIGAICGVLALLRSDLLLLPFAIAGAWLLRHKVRHGVAAGALLVATAAIVVAPYAIWNHTTHGRFSPVPLAGAVGPSIYLSTWQHRLGQDDLNAIYKGEIRASVKASGLASELETLNQEAGAPSNTAPFNPTNYATNEQQRAISLAALQAGLSRIKAEPGAYGLHVLQNVWALWATSVYPSSTPSLIKFAFDAISYGMLALGMAGVVLSFFRPAGWMLPWTPAVILLYIPAIHLWLHTEARYTAPVRPILLLFAAAAIQWLYCRWRASRSEQA
jgi:hypothetical protein